MTLGPILPCWILAQSWICKDINRHDEYKTDVGIIKLTQGMLSEHVLPLRVLAFLCILHPFA